ncbi:uncharacterized protein LOC116647346 [Phoca vitulina]|uniref:uncharacterized protein LOC116647346 n=1 Tax=Phoca vitulina TaxID=9720 RepID=UPI001395CFA1|nr:uncharacterized protein LOC116647346 [Phoca vitulina]
MGLWPLANNDRSLVQPVYGVWGPAAPVLQRIAARILSASRGKPQQGEGLGPGEAAGFPETSSLSGPCPSSRSSAPRLRGPGGSASRAGPPGQCGGGTHGCPALTHSDSKTREGTLHGDWRGCHGWSGPGGDPSEPPSRSQERGRRPSLHSPGGPPPCGFRLRGAGRRRGRRDGVCLTTGFNLKHMYWLKFILPAGRQDHKIPFPCVSFDFGKCGRKEDLTLVQQREYLPRPHGLPFLVGQESGLDTALWTEGISVQCQAAAACPQAMEQSPWTGYWVGSEGPSTPCTLTLCPPRALFRGSP